ncbi:MAG: hypothetical protein HYU88_09955 [Chloroflexi bacterium]|nr:hypothetical protein [Chloroflexota bacterium]MBI4505040.1 hypothetical protein [Chloroflexota bacterium]
MSAPAGPAEGRARRHEVPADVAAVNELFDQRGWTDGLPVIPPTEDLVAAMLACSPYPASHVLGRMQPLNGTVTAEKVATNAVMAGCRPEYFAVVLAAVKAVLQPQFHVGSTACTTGGAAPAIVVNGPIARQLGINSGTACFGGNVRPNATIGRALRLVMRNLGGAKPGGMEKSTQAWPGKMSLCFAESEERSPWEPLHVERGYPADASTVTVVAVRGIYPVTEGAQETGLGILQTLAGGMRVVGAAIYTQVANGIPVIVALCPEHATEIARAGFSRRDVRHYLHEHARLPVRDVVGRGLYASNEWPVWIDRDDPRATVPVVSSADDIILVVAGGDGRHSAWLPAWNVCRGAVERVVEP